MFVFWIGLLFGVLFVWLAVRCGFYETWIHLFNIVVSIYLAIFLRSFIKDLIPETAFNESYSDALIILITSAAVFVVLYGISYVFFSSQFRVSVPRLFDVVGSGFLGFLSGMLVWSFLSFLICITPLSNNTTMQQIGFNPQFWKNFSYMSWWVDRVNNLVSYKSNFLSTDKVIDKMVATTKAELEKKRPIQKIPVQQRPIKTTEPNDMTFFETVEKDKTCAQNYEPNESNGSKIHTQSTK
jgi:hypothetical protein